MKNAAPMFAPGWMSQPVLECAHSVMMRAIIGTPKSYSACAMRYTLTASTPGIGEDHFIQIRRRRIAVERRLHIADQQARGSPAAGRRKICANSCARGAHSPKSAAGPHRARARSTGNVPSRVRVLGASAASDLRDMRAKILARSDRGGRSSPGYMRSSTELRISTMASREGR